MGQRLPDFLIIGAQKAGTRWLLNNLRRHPQLGMPSDEIHFFDKSVNYSKGLGWYAEQFAAFDSELLLGEKTPDYLWYRKEDLLHHQANIPSKIKAAMPDVKLICVLRDPVERAISAINHLLREGYMSRHDLAEVFKNQALITEHGVVEIGLYHVHLKALLREFDREQMHIAVYEHDIRIHPVKGINEMLRFLKVDEVTPEFVDLTPMNVSKVNLGKSRVYKLGSYTLFDKRTKWQPTDEERHRLYQYYQPHNEKLFEILGHEIDEWKA